MMIISELTLHPFTPTIFPWTESHFCLIHFKSKAMKRIIFTLILLLIFSGFTCEAQILKKIKKRTEQTAERVILRRAEQKTEKETEKAIDTLFASKKDSSGNSSPPEPGPGNNEMNTPPPPETVDANSAETLTSGSPEVWTKYNFIPGDEILFSDELSNEENGEFPSRWNLLKGNAENAIMEGEPVIKFSNSTIITPLINEKNYLPEVFTLEFDAWFDKEEISSQVYFQRYKIRFWEGTSHFRIPDSGPDFSDALEVYRHGARLDGKINGTPRKVNSFKDQLNNNTGEWRHIAIAFNQRSLKVFVNEFRALNIPVLGFNPSIFSIEAYTHPGFKDRPIRAIKNIRLASGGKKLYDRIVADGKFITRGILFDVNKASIKPESGGTLNEIAQMMREHPEIRFRIEGHTDSDGDPEYNLKLSTQRSLAVKDALTNLNIDPGRMEAIGLGESKPIAENTSPEGKANNRRVEFIKI